jgi:hypothetical protein
VSDTPQELLRTTFEQVLELKTQRALGKQTGSILDWQQSAAVGLSTYAAYSGNQNQSFGLSESRRRLIWSVQTLDNAAMTENVRSTRPAPAPSLAGNAGYASTTCDPSTGAACEPSAKFEPTLRAQRRPPGTFRQLTTCRGFSTTK